MRTFMYFTCITIEYDAGLHDVTIACTVARPFSALFKHQKFRLLGGHQLSCSMVIGIELAIWRVVMDLQYDNRCHYSKVETVGNSSFENLIY